MTDNGSSLFLRRVLLLDCVISGVTGLAMLAGSDLIGRLIGAPPAFVQYAGGSLLPFAAFVFYLSQRDLVSRGAIWTVIALNVAWVAGSVLLLFIDAIAPTAFGTAFIVLQAIAVASFAEMQYVGLRKAWR
jgi:hypothetical protein